MKIFADTANIDELKELLSWGIIDGCTTNPSIILKEKGVDFEKHIKKICKLFVGKPVSVEVTTNDLKPMINQARELAEWSDNINIKIPMGLTGLKAVNELRKDGIKTNVTACMNMPQTVLAAKAGATYVSLFWGRIEDMGYDGLHTLDEITALWGFQTEIILGSLRTVSDVTRAMQSHADILTIPTLVLKKLPFHPRTDSTIAEFLANWDKFCK